MSKGPHFRRPRRYPSKQTLRPCLEVLENRPNPTMGYFVNLGQEQAAEDKEGSIVLNTFDFVNSGTLSASEMAGESGSVWVGFTASCTDATVARILASGSFDMGCSVTIDGGHRSRSYSSGSFDFTCTTAGAINLFAQDVTMLAASVDAFGSSGVGRVRNAQTATLSLAA